MPRRTPRVPELSGEVETDQHGPPEVRAPARRTRLVGRHREGAPVVAGGLLVGQASRGVPGGRQQQIEAAVALQGVAGEVGVAGQGARRHRVA